MICKINYDDDDDGPDPLGKIILVPDSLGKCFPHTPLEFPFHIPVWVKNGIGYCRSS